MSALKALFCSECGIELDSDDVDANMATWGVFRSVCSDCVCIVDPPKVSNYSIKVPR